MKRIFTISMFLIIFSCLSFPQITNQWKTFTITGTNGVLKDYYCYCITIDNMGIVWVGGSGHGVYKYEKGKWENFETDSSESKHAQVKSIIPRGSNSFLYSYDLNVIGFDNGIFSTEYQANVSYLAEDDGGDIWGAGTKGLYKFKGSKQINFDTTDVGSIIQAAGKIVVDKNKVLWGMGEHQSTGTNDTIPSIFLFSFDGNKLKIFPSRGIQYGNFQTVYVDDNNNIWVAQWGSGNGAVAKYDQVNDIWQEFELPQPTDPSSYVASPPSAIAVDKNGVLWVGTDYGLAGRIGDKWTLYNRANGNSTLGGDWITGIAVDSSNNKWISYFSDGNDYAGIAEFNEHGILTGIENNKNQIPSSFSLSQNYPNPFNPSTIIKYQIPKESFVTLKIYDVLGREVKQLVNEEKSAGNYSVTLNASSLASGIYFYRITAGSYTSIKKMVLLK